MASTAISTDRARELRGDGAGIERQLGSVKVEFPCGGSEQGEGVHATGGPHPAAVAVQNTPHVAVVAITASPACADVGVQVVRVSTLAGHGQAGKPCPGTRPAAGGVGLE